MKGFDNLRNQSVAPPQWMMRNVDDRYSTYCEYADPAIISLLSLGVLCLNFKRIIFVL